MPPLEPRDVERLRRFERQVRKVFDSTVVQERNLNISWKITFRHGAVDVEAKHASGDPLEALANKVRVTTLHRDEIRFEDICELLARTVSTDGARAMIAQAREGWEAAKAGSMGVGVVLNQVQLTPYDAFALWFYGHVAHANPDKVARFDMLSADPVTASLLQLKVVEFLTSVLDPLDQIAMLSKHIADHGREPKFGFRADEEGRVWSVSMSDGSAVPTPDFPYEDFGMVRPPPLDSD